VYLPLDRWCALCNAKKLREAPPIKADDHFAADKDNRHTHLAALVDHFSALLLICCNIVLGVLHVICSEELLAHLAEVAGWCGVNGD